MYLFNLLINVLVAVLFVVLAFWLITLIPASLGFPLIAIFLLKVFVVMIALGWAFGLLGGRIPIDRF